jgi:hypothetical protein
MTEPKTPPLRVMLVDDHEVVRNGISSTARSRTGG